MAEKKKEAQSSPTLRPKATQGQKLKAESNEEKKSTAKTRKPVTAPEIQPVEELAGAKNIRAWELAGLMRAAGWAPGKQVSEGEFDLALERFRKRPQGGGKI